MSDVRITVGDDGPYIVQGDITLTADDGRELDLPYDVQLCRCGHSQIQPFSMALIRTHDHDRLDPIRRQVHEVGRNLAVLRARLYVDWTDTRPLSS